MASHVNSAMPPMDIHLDKVVTGGRTRASITTEDYAAAIRSHAKPVDRRTLYPGQIYEDLSEYLDGAPLAPRLSKTHDGEVYRPRNHASLYTLGSSSERPPMAFSDVTPCVKELHANFEKELPQLLFLRGYSSSSWLTGVATALATDPEFLNSNLLFRCRETYASYPALPSAYEDIVRLRLVTIGSRGTHRTGHPKPQVVEQIRARAKKEMKRYHNDLMSRDVHCGDSIVRDYHVLGENHFLLEQEVSVCLHFDRQPWTALICSDIGNSLVESLHGPWLSESDIRAGSMSKTTFHPTIQHRKKAAFRTKTVSCEDDEGFDKNFPQTASLLALDYGQHLDNHAMSLDPFYALHDLFRFAASSENQVLNLLEDYIRHDTSHESLADEEPTLSNLIYCQEILEAHTGRLKDTTEFVRRRGGPHWPKVNPQEKTTYAKADAAAEALLRDFEHLHARAQVLAKRCQRGMSVMMNNRSIAQSKQSISQAKKVQRLTLIAFIYIPLSFTTSLFGMNVTSFGTGTTPIWVWVATSAPLLILTVMGFYIDFNWLLGVCGQMVHRTLQIRGKRKAIGVV